MKIFEKFFVSGEAVRHPQQQGTAVNKNLRQILLGTSNSQWVSDFEAVVKKVFRPIRKRPMVRLSIGPRAGCRIGSKGVGSSPASDAPRRAPRAG
ncbi:MAG: hypothetical protein KatS3mg109_1952 [Pirellulaceae bacterium]|nr:MAG: hypothetical protein KatS3mg109_1952 [Pirellulaceae bacterium]